MVGKQKIEKMSSVETFFDKMINSVFFGSNLRRRKSLEKLREKRNSRLEEVYGLSSKRNSFEKHPFDGKRVDRNARNTLNKEPSDEPAQPL